MWKDSIRNIVVIFQTTILRFVGFYVNRCSAIVLLTDPPLPLSDILDAFLNGGWFLKSLEGAIKLIQWNLVIVNSTCNLYYKQSVSPESFTIESFFYYSVVTFLEVPLYVHKQAQSCFKTPKFP